jgi:hypothetical protein
MSNDRAWLGPHCSRMTINPGQPAVTVPSGCGSHGPWQIPPGSGRITSLTRPGMPCIRRVSCEQDRGLAVLTRPREPQGLRVHRAEETARRVTSKSPLGRDPVFAAPIQAVSYRTGQQVANGMNDALPGSQRDRPSQPVWIKARHSAIIASKVWTGVVTIGRWSFCTRF